MGGQKKGFQDRRVLTTVALVPTRSPFRFNLAKQLFFNFQVYGREVVESHYRACLYAGVNISGTNAEVKVYLKHYQGEND